MVVKREVASPLSVSRLRPLVTKVKPRVSMATPVVCTDSPMYQLMNEDLPALWLPMIITFTFFRGLWTVELRSSRGSPAISRRPSDPSVPGLRPCSYSSWMRFRMRSVLDMPSASLLVVSRFLALPAMVVVGAIA